MVIFEALEEDAAPDSFVPGLVFDSGQLAEIVEDEEGECLDSFVSISKANAETGEDKITYKNEAAYLRRKDHYTQGCSYDELQKTPEQEDEEERRLFGWQSLL